MNFLGKRQFNLADYAFIISAMCFIIATLLKIKCLGECIFNFMGVSLDCVILFYYISEAALVGSIADWFAVTALFKTPWICNFIPVKAVREHTALLPKSKASFIANCGKMVEEEFLTRESLLEIKKNTHFVNELVAYLEIYDNRKKFEQLLSEFAVSSLKGLDTEKLSVRLERYVKDSLKDVDTKNKIMSLIKEDLDESKNEKLYDDLITLIHNATISSGSKDAIKVLITNFIDSESKKSFLNKLKYKSVKFVGVLDEDELAKEFHDASVATTSALKEDTYLRQWFINKTNMLMQNMLYEPLFSQIMNDIQKEAVENISLQRELKLVLDKLIIELCQPINDLNKSEVAITSIEIIINQATITLLSELKQNVILINDIEKYLQHISELVVLRVQSMIGGVIQTIMSGMSDEKLNDIVYSKIRIDLQNIRLNGTCIGAILGGTAYILKMVI
ncbi:MAG: DUF445 domain-containing protein [Methanobrevibacter sp.]|nr:DUF445 domain-containing protein [Methanobrevibacter sp.]